MVGLVPTIHPSAGSGAWRSLDPRDKPEDDTAIFHCWPATGVIQIAKFVPG